MGWGMREVEWHGMGDECEFRACLDWNERLSWVSWLGCGLVALLQKRLYWTTTSQTVHTELSVLELSQMVYSSNRM